MKRKKSKRLGCASVVVIVILALSAFTAVPVSAAVATVTRDLPVVVSLSETFDVTLMQTNFLFNIGTVTETLPAGFAYVDGSYTGHGAVTYTAATRTLTMGFREETVVTYTVTASSFDQTATFAGTYATVVPNPDPDHPFIYESGAVSGDTAMGVDGTAPYTEGHNPAKWATGVPVDTNIVVYVRDNYALDPNSVKMTVAVSDVTSQLSLTPLALGNWLVTYNPPGNLTFNYLYTITIDATDAAGNAMTQEVYTFRTEQATVPDEEPPVISNIASSSITNTTATITWDTDEVADSLVKYGTAPGTYTMQESEATDVTSHSVGLTGLDPNTTYYYVVNSTDLSDNSAESGENSFTTLAGPPGPDEEPPVISNIASSSITNTTATITWDTDEVADSLVKYGTTQGGPYGMTASDPTNVTSHSVGLSGLTNNTTYYYVVNSTDPSDNSAESTEYSFTTLAGPDEEPPVISNIASSSITNTTATITWDTDEVADSLVKYGTTQGGPYGMTASDPTDVTSHSVGLTGLTPNMTYYYVVNSTDPSGNSAESGENSFTTLEEGALPRWDINEDRVVNYIDLAILSAHWGETTSPPYPRWDINEDGTVNYIDLAILSAHWGETY